MNTTSRLVTAVLVCCGTLTVAAAPGANPNDQATSIAAVLDDFEKRLIDAAEAIPDDKYGFAPTACEFKGVSTFGEQVKHIADDNYGSFASSTSAVAQVGTGAKSQKNELTMAALLDNELSDLEKQFVEAADAMPEDKYGFKPTKGEFEGVRTFGEQVKHVAFYNYATFGIMFGEKPPAETEADRGPDAVRTKADILKYARDSFAVGHRATAAISMQNVTARMEDLPDVAHGVTRLQMMMFVLRHAASHYGQMVEYLRMNGIIPPASRPTRQ